MCGWILENWESFVGPFLFVTAVSVVKINLDLWATSWLASSAGDVDRQNVRENAFNSTFNLIGAILLIIGGVWSVYNASQIDKKL